MRSLVLVPLAVLSFTGCVDSDGEYGFGGGPGPNGSAGDGGPPVLTTTVATGTTGSAQWHSPIAIGGSTFVSVTHGRGAGIQVRQSSPAFELVAAPSPASATEYVLAANAQAHTTLIVTSVNYPEDREDIAAFAVDDVRLVPAQGANHRGLGGAVAWHTSTKQAVFALTAGATRLVDVSLAIMFASSEELELAAWDTLTLPITPGRYNVLVSADSFSQRQFPFELVSSIDRIEATVDGTLARVGDTAEVCFYPLLGTLDVAVPVAFELGGYGGLVQVGLAPASNCRTVEAKIAGVQQIDAEALDRRTSLTFTIAP